MEVKLLVIGGKHPGQEIAVPGPKFLIGRAEECQLRPRSDQVSRRHCEILVEEGRAAIRDLGSRNGTLVNGEQVKGERDLKAGDRLSIGPLDFEVQLTVRVGGKKKPKVHSVQEAAARTVQAAAGDDMDIANWLEDEEDEDSIAAGGAGPQTQPAQETVAETPASAQPPKKPKPDTSREAAADVLRQIFSPRRP
jgi:pSer/pThr/pTyr-binding forkhead associated (FHA) protein